MGNLSAVLLEELQRNDPGHGTIDGANTLDVTHNEVTTRSRPAELGTATANSALKLAIPDASKGDKATAAGSNNQSRADTRMNSASNRPSTK